MRVDDPTGPWPPRARPSGPVVYRRRTRVLVVDDEPSICVALFQALTAEGFDPIVAQSGEAALSIVQSEPIDVMLIDLRIPDRRGDMIFESAAAEQPHLRHQTLFMTGDITERAEELIGECGCNYLQKPFDLDVLVAALRALSPTVAHGRGGVA